MSNSGSEKSRKIILIVYKGHYMERNNPSLDLNMYARADHFLKLSTQFLFLVVVAGQWIFAAYVVTFYGGSAAHGDLAKWNKVLPHGYVVGDGVGNFAVAMHLLLAFIVIVGGPLQFVSMIRSRFPSFHRWNGRIYLPTAVACSLIGVFMGWTRGAIGSTLSHYAITGNAIVIVFCAAMTLRYALARKFPIHRRWALRLFFAVGGVWFFRVGLMFWVIVNQGPVGFDPSTFLGPFLTFLSFAQYVVPLAVVEIYLRIQDCAGARGKLAMAAGLLVLTIAMGVGIFGATMFMWLPRI